MLFLVAKGHFPRPDVDQVNVGQPGSSPGAGYRTGPKHEETYKKDGDPPL